MKIKLLLLSIFIASNLSARVRLDINLVHKKGIERNHFLSNQVASAVTLSEGEATHLEISDLDFEIKAKLIDYHEAIGPEAHVVIETQVYKKEGQSRKLISKYDSKRLAIGKKDQVLDYQAPNGSIELTVRPHLP